MSTKASIAAIRTNLALIVLAFSCGCATNSSGYLDEESGELLAQEPEQETIVCRYEASLGSNLKKKVCRRQLSETERQENIKRTRDDMDEIRAEQLIKASQPSMDAASPR
jgi:hypothetical protein